MYFEKGDFMSIFKKLFFLSVFVFGYLLVSIPDVYANRFAGKELVNCCVIENRDLCPVSIKNGKEEGCITEEEKQTLLEKNAMLTCIGSKLVGACKCSCFAPSTRVLVVRRSTSETRLIALSELIHDSELYYIKTLSLENNNSQFHITSCDPTTVLVFHMADGSLLKVTPEHPILLPTGKMVMAGSLLPGQYLTHHSGYPVSIQSITEEMSADGVLNVVIDVESEAEHTIIAEGFLVGDAGWQRALLGIK